MGEGDDRQQIEETAARLKAAVAEAGGKERVSALSGVPLSTLNTYIYGKADPKISVFARLASACGVQVHELLGVGETNASLASYKIEQDGFVAVPRLDVRASAGRGRLAIMDASDQREFVAFREEWLRRIGINPAHAQALTAVGDSMEPTIRDGDLLLIDRSIDRIIDNGIYVVVMAGMVVVKRLQTRLDGTVILKSDNRDRYDDEIVPAHDVPELIVEGRVRWFGRAI